MGQGLAGRTARPQVPHPGHEPAGHRVRRDRGEHRALGVPATVKVIHAAPCDLTDGRYDHTTWLGKLI